jgi:hypothetical protein
MEIKKITVSSRNGSRTTSGAIIVRSKGNTREVKAVVFSSSEARILDSYIDKMKK